MLKSVIPAIITDLQRRLRLRLRFISASPLGGMELTSSSKDWSKFQHRRRQSGSPGLWTHLVSWSKSLSLASLWACSNLTASQRVTLLAFPVQRLISTPRRRPQMGVRILLLFIMEQCWWNCPTFRDGFGDSYVTRLLSRLCRLRSKHCRLCNKHCRYRYRKKMYNWERYNWD